MKNDRKSPTFWTNEAKEYAKQAEKQLSQYREFCERFRGDLSNVAYNDNADGTGQRASGFANLTQLTARIMRADVAFRCPQPIVAPPQVDRVLFTGKLARLETRLLQDFAQDADYYREMRRAAIDYVLGASAIVKLNIGRSSEYDLRAMKIARQKADIENELFNAGVARPKVKASDGHAAHIEQHGRWLAQAQRSGQILDADAEIMLAHIKKHAEAIAYDRAGSPMQRERVTIERIHPESFSCDPWAERPYSREWYKTRFTARIEDAQANPAYDREAVGAIVPCHVRRPEVPMAGQALRVRDSIQTLDEHFLCHEVVDMIESTVVLYAEGGTRPLLARPWTLGAVIPSGPFEEVSMIEDPDECWGVPPPVVAKDHQVSMSEVFGIATETVRRSLPMQIINSRILDVETIERIKNGDVAEVIVATNVPPDADLSKFVMNVEPCEVPQQNFLVGQQHGAMFDRMLGLGSPKLSGGDASETATKSAISAGYANSLSEDSAAQWDDFQVRVLRKVCSFHRAILPQSQVYETCGKEALDPDGWPKTGFTDRDIRENRNVSIVPGSSRRNDSPIVTKMAGEGLQMWLSDPSSQLYPDITFSLYQRYFESTGWYGIDWEAKKQQAVLMAAMQAAAAQASPPGQQANPGETQVKPGGKSGEPSSNGKAKRPSEASTPSAAGQNGGLANAGGGRVPTGAGQGDPMRFIR